MLEVPAAEYFVVTLPRRKKVEVKSCEREYLELQVKYPWTYLRDLHLQLDLGWESTTYLRDLYPPLDLGWESRHVEL